MCFLVLIWRLGLGIRFSIVVKFRLKSDVYATLQSCLQGKINDNKCQSAR